MKFKPANKIQDLQYFGEFGGVNPSISDSATYSFLTANKMLEFKGWKCQSMIFYINHEGVIYNECTKKLLPALFTRDDIREYKSCPQRCCDRMSFIYYNKLHYHRRRES